MLMHTGSGEAEACVLRYRDADAVRQMLLGVCAVPALYEAEPLNKRRHEAVPHDAGVYISNGRPLEAGQILDFKKRARSGATALGVVRCNECRSKHGLGR